jgi:hypothetical protein
VKGLALLKKAQYEIQPTASKTGTLLQKERKKKKII